jgi:hypothetical protein
VPAWLNLDVWVGDMENPARREAYRPAEVRIDGVIFVVIEPPGSPDLRLEAGSIRIDSGVGEPPHCQTKLPEPPPGYFRAYFFLDELNTFLHLVGKGAVLEWRGDEWISGSAVP